MKVYGMVGGCVALLAFAAGVHGAGAHIEALSGTVQPGGTVRLLIDEDPQTHEQFEFEMVVNSSALTGADSFEYVLAMDGNGVAFDLQATESATTAVASDPLHSPIYLLLDDNSGPWAEEDVFGDPATLSVSDLSASSSKYNPNERPSLGVFVVKIADDAAAMGLHTLTGGGVLIGSEEQISLDSLVIEVVPEPSALGLLAAAGVGLLRRRRRRP